MKLIFTITIFSLVVGCSTINVQNSYPNKVEIKTPGIKILGSTSEFVLETGKVVIPPFYVKDVVFYGQIENDYVDAIKYGSQRVYFLQEGNPDTLYGILYFGGYPSIVENYKCYTMVFSEEAIDEVRDGSIKYFGEYMDLKKFRLTSNGRKSEGLYPWLLWLSSKSDFGFSNDN